MKTRGVLFDLYGTLIVYGEMEKAWNDWCDVIHDLFRRQGLSMTAAEFRRIVPDFLTNRNQLTIQWG